MQIITAIPYYNDNNKYIYHILLKIFYFKLVKDFNVFIKNILELYYNKTHVLKKNISFIPNCFYREEFYNFIIKIVVPKTIKQISILGFAYNYKLKTVILPDELEIIDACAFACCFSLEEINIPKNIRYIDKSCFCDCKNLKTIFMYKETKISLDFVPEYTEIKLIN